jgi:LAGLIDADG DNA endonuclease family.
MYSSNAILRNRLDKRNNKIYNTLHFSTRAIPFLNFFYDLFYRNKIKVIPSSIGNLLTNIGLAQWIMDDGSFQSGLILQTNAYTLLEVENLINVLLSNFNINSYIRIERNYPVIYIPADQINLVRSLVLNHMHPSTHYKLGINI